MAIHSRESTSDDSIQAPDYSIHPRALIVGAGLAGILLAILLEHSGTLYKIFERAAEVKPIELLKVSFPILDVTLCNENLKRVMKNGPINTKELRVPTRNNDNTIYDGDILVGADGANSAVHQNLYKQLAQEEDKLPFSDAEQMNVPGNRICWHIMNQFNSQAADDESFRNSEWTHEANEAIIPDAASFKTPHGAIGGLIEQTPKEHISRVFIEDKLFET
ncbi:hypothetical protein BGZ92_001553 [Podila epicladia]|nr:hypothetical protein BGZ92_001553 [Podila epicladia]